CYDHLAGRLGIALTDALTGRGLLRQDTGFALTDAGLGWFEAAGIALRPTGRRPLARACLDWTERRPHLAGVAGAALCRHALDTGWCVRIGSGRAVKVTEAGERALSELLGIEAAALGA
ncbi:transcriptional regulator, partial [Streptomyces olivaceus]